MDCFETFSTFFYQNRVFINGKPYPLGQVTADVLNLDPQIFVQIEKHTASMLPPASEFFRHPSKAFAREAQPKLNAVWDLIFALPLYRDLAIDKDPYYHLFQLLLDDPEKLAVIKDHTSEYYIGLVKILHDLALMGEGLFRFQKLCSLFLDHYLEPIKIRNTENYAMAFANYHSDLLYSAIKHDRDAEWGRNFPIEVSFVPMAHETEPGKVILAEKAKFTSILDFLPTEFYRGLMVGNAPRRCHNCGRYFLLTTGYNMCYCNNIALGETERTCRMIGAHRKESLGKENQTPVQREYAKAYNRLKQRRYRDKIDTDQWNTDVANAQHIVEQSEQGKLDDEEAISLLREI